MPLKLKTTYEFATEKATALEAALCVAGGLSNVEECFDERILHAANKQFTFGLSIHDAMRVAAAENGHRDYFSDSHRLFDAAFRRDPLLRAAGFSTFDLSGILSNVANKFFADGFNAVEPGWREIAAVRPASDFKETSTYALTYNLVYEKVGAGGELKHGTLGELEYHNQIETYAKLFSVPRRDIINDDLGAFTQVPRKLGRGAALAFNQVFWQEFLSGVGTFWAAGNNNLITGGGSALSSAGLQAALTKFKKLVDPQGQPLGSTPKILLVPSELEITADQLMTSTQVNTGGASTEAEVPNRNAWFGKYKVVSSSYLSNSTYTGYSETAWWLLADPKDLAAIEVAFLNGRDTPLIDSAAANFNTMGVDFRGIHDFGVRLQEPRASVRSAGA